MPRRRFVYTEGGKPLPNGPVEVEVSQGSSATKDTGFTAQEGDGTPRPQSGPDSGAWTDYDGGDE